MQRIAAFLLCFWCLPTAAWNATGHRLIAHIAWAELSAPARNMAFALLNKHPDFSRWQANAPSIGHAFIFSEASLWADQIRHDNRFATAADPSPPYLPGFPDMHRHSEWHYADATEPLADNLYKALLQLYTRLANPQLTAHERAYALVWIIHLVGDAHQPLHNGFRNDRGGNEVDVILFQEGSNRTTNLHAFWDDLPGRTRADSTSLLHIAEALTGNDRVTAGTLNISRWQEENSQLCKTMGYPTTLQPQPIILSSQFVERSHKIARHQLVLAGRRLAQLLESAFSAQKRTPFHVEHISNRVQH